ncbi:piggyBac transposable element-derived protein 4-like [Liolophura sinensis]|uniref:piggyBac transposable element-derived protein 4-like n=1 Tax=Liolophura sinensis TaxID=3198878 RepID=UPI003158C2C1
MARDRFEKILQYFHYNDSTTNPARGDANHDKIHHVRPVFSIVQRRLVENYRPHKSVTLDKAMIPFRGRVSYRQYLPAKPCKFGVKVWQLADSSNGYVYQMEVYTGKQDTGREVGLAWRVVWDLTRVLSGKSHHIYMDNYFSSPQLYQDLLKDDLYGCGTCRLNRKGWPDALHKNCLPKQKGVSKLYQKENLVAACCECPAKTEGWNACRNKGPEVVENYNKHMNGLDHGDQLRMQYSTTRRSKKFWKYLFWFLFNTAVACSFILMRESVNHQKKSKTGRVKEMCQLKFRQNLAKQLVGQHRQKRRHEVLQKDSAGRSHWPTSMPKSRRCKLCSSRKIRKESKYGRKICDGNLCVECFEPFHVLSFTEE